MTAETVKLLITVIGTLIASSGFWSYQVKRLERRYQVADKSDEVQKKLDQIISTQEQHTKHMQALRAQLEKTDEVTMAVARDRIYYLCAHAIQVKDTDPDMMRDIRSLLDPYKANGGNGIADEYFNRYEHMYKTAQHTEGGR